MNSTQSHSLTVRLSAEVFQRLVQSVQDALREGAVAIQLNLVAEDGTTVELVVEADHD
jgi:hypothetical protein